ncbi:hypothetical protein AX16_005891 [Volvariella volvacea WC 439]|nr:hypothetical protein AX16_005891 [Volvariella volvacea WC 439]
MLTSRLSWEQLEAELSSERRLRKALETENHELALEVASLKADNDRLRLQLQGIARILDVASSYESPLRGNRVSNLFSDAGPSLKRKEAPIFVDLDSELEELESPIKKKHQIPSPPPSVSKPQKARANRDHGTHQGSPTRPGSVDVWASTALIESEPEDLESESPRKEKRRRVSSPSEVSTTPRTLPGRNPSTASSAEIELMSRPLEPTDTQSGNNISAFLSDETLTYEFPSTVIPVEASRDFLHWAYNIRPRKLWSLISCPITGGERHIFFPTLSLSPFLPQACGKPGVLYSVPVPEDSTSPWYNSEFTLFVRYSAGKWTYLGEYQKHMEVQMAEEQFMAQDIDVREKWASLIANATMDTPLGRVRDQIIGINGGQDDIIRDCVQAFDQGKLHLSIIGIKCIGYDYEFADNIRDQLLEWSRQGQPTR